MKATPAGEKLVIRLKTDLTTELITTHHNRMHESIWVLLIFSCF